MGFVLIKGRFRPSVGVPDGDSLRFVADDPDLWLRLEGRPANVSKSGPTTGTVQLRLEGIDAIEKGAQQPLATQARDSLFALIGFDAQTNPEPQGYVLSRMTDDQSRRPIAFAFAGAAAEQDGANVFLDETRLQDSINYRQVLAGFAYPLYYNTLFASLRSEFDAALRQAKQDAGGYWPTDATLSGVTVTGVADLVTIPPIWPKLWRRLEAYLRVSPDLSGFLDFLEGKDERIDILSIMEERGLQDVVEVSGSKVRLTVPPEDIRVVGHAGQRTR